MDSPVSTARATTAAPPGSTAQEIFERAPDRLRDVLSKVPQFTWRAAEEGYYGAVGLTKLDLAELREAAQNGDAGALKIVRVREKVIAEMLAAQAQPAAALSAGLTPGQLALLPRMGFTAEVIATMEKQIAGELAGRDVEAELAVRGF